MPTDHGLRPDDLQSVQHARCQPIQPGKYQTVDAAEGYSKDSLADLLNQKQTSSKYTVAAILRSDAMIDSLRKEIRRLSGLRLEPDYLSNLLDNEIVKRGVDRQRGRRGCVRLYQEISKGFQQRARRGCSASDQSHGRSEAIRRLVELGLKAKK
jgi:hypothetical protein